jgi:periplasmic protein CpxP/Spy
MKRSIKIAIAAAALATVATGTVAVAYAQMPGRGFGPMGPGGAARICDRGPAMLSGWLAYAESRLNITPEQRTAWTSFATDARAAGDTLLKLCPELTSAQQPDRNDINAQLARHERMLTAGLDALKIARPAIERLNAVLTPEQRTRLTELLPGGPGGRYGRFGHRMDRRGPPPAPPQGAPQPPRGG